VLLRCICDMGTAYHNVGAVVTPATEWQPSVLQPTLGRPEARRIVQHARRCIMGHCNGCCQGEASTRCPDHSRSRSAARAPRSQALQPLQGALTRLSCCPTSCEFVPCTHSLHVNRHCGHMLHLKNLAGMEPICFAQVAKPRADFHCNRTTADGLQYQCRNCHQEV
jgi:hypothetical protein